MRTRRVIRLILSLYLWGFLLYQTTPVRIVPYTSYAPETFHPKPFLHTYTFAYGVRTAFSNHAGSLKNLLSAMEEKGFDFAFGDFPEALEGKLFPEPEETLCQTLELSGPSLLRSVLHTLFETVPRSLAGSSPPDVLSREDPPPVADCYLVTHRGRVLVSTFLGVEIPPYGTILGERRNTAFLRDPPEDPERLLRGTVVTFRTAEVRAFGYSERSFYLPGEETRYPFRYVVETDSERSLILIYRDGELEGIFDRRRVSYPVSRKGSYTALVMSYRFRIHIFYFGLRTVAVVSPIRLI